MQPLRLAADAEAGFVHMFDWGRRNQVTHGIREGLEALGAVMADPGDRRGDEMHAE